VDQDIMNDDCRSFVRSTTLRREGRAFVILTLAAGCSSSGQRASDPSSDASFVDSNAEAFTDSGSGSADSASREAASAAHDAGADGAAGDTGDIPLDDGSADSSDSRVATDGDAAHTDAAAETLAATPPMGWNSWNTFECNLSETLIESVADVFVSSGMQAAGYEYVNLDDCWMDGRDSNGNLKWNATKFPSGIPALASYVHGKGLKFGIYETPNAETCVGIYGGISPSVAVGSLGHETQDAATFASWGVDFLKYDLCNGERSSFATMRDALRATGRPIVYSVNPGDGSGYPQNTPGWDPISIANMWRFAPDISASYGSVTSILDLDAPFFGLAGPGHWNDADMLEVGKGMTTDQDRSHFSMWAMLAAPLLAGNDIRSMSATSQSILTNIDVIAIDQDPLGNQAQLVATPHTNLQIWSKVLSGQDTRAVALLNRTGAAASITVEWTTLGLPTGSATLRDLWTHTDLGTFANSYTATAIPSDGVVMLRAVAVGAP
jgi:alpha-galactosidase